MTSICRRNFRLVLAISTFVFASCVSSPNAQSSTLSNDESRNVVILGEGGKNLGTIQYYANKYNATVFYKEKKASCGFLCEAVSSSIRNTFRTSGGIQRLAGELKSINYGDGEWTLIVPSFAERYFILVLHNMEDGALSNAKASVQLIDSSKNKSIETEVNRVSEGKMKVAYGRL